MFEANKSKVWTSDKTPRTIDTLVEAVIRRYRI